MFEVSSNVAQDDRPVVLYVVAEYDSPVTLDVVV